MDLQLADKVAVVTGAGKGIGLAVTRALVDEGFRIDTSDLQVPSGEALRAVDLDAPIAHPAPGDKLMISGYPGASRRVDYEARQIAAFCLAEVARPRRFALFAQL